MDDLRVLWMRDRVYGALGLTDPQLFEELLSRDDGEVEDLILHFLNRTSDEEGASTLFFFRTVVPEEVLVETGEPAAAPPPPPAGLGLHPAGPPGLWVSLAAPRGPHSPLGKSALERVVTANASSALTLPQRRFQTLTSTP